MMGFICPTPSITCGKIGFAFGNVKRYLEKFKRKFGKGLNEGVDNRTSGAICCAVVQMLRDNICHLTGSTLTIFVTSGVELLPFVPVGGD
jgi:hypothetical protein